MKWDKAKTDIISIVYDGTKECEDALHDKDLFIDDSDPIRGKILNEAYGLCSFEEIGEIHEGDRVVIALNNAFIVSDEFYKNNVCPTFIDLEASEDDIKAIKRILETTNEVPIIPVPKKAERRGCYDVALFIEGMANLRTVRNILAALNDAEIYEDYSTFDYEYDGLHFEAKTDKESIEKDIERICKDWGRLKIVWEAMNVW